MYSPQRDVIRKLCVCVCLCVPAVSLWFCSAILLAQCCYPGAWSNTDPLPTCPVHVALGYGFWTRWACSGIRRGGAFASGCVCVCVVGWRVLISPHHVVPPPLVTSGLNVPFSKFKRMEIILVFYDEITTKWFSKLISVLLWATFSRGFFFFPSMSN